jgi:hypothetical protein
MSTISEEESNSYALYQKVAKKIFDTSIGITYEDWKRLVTPNP